MSEIPENKKTSCQEPLNFLIRINKPLDLNQYKIKLQIYRTT